MITAVAEKGYRSVTVAEVVSRARVSRSSFYAQFEDKEGCFFAATAKGCESMFGRVRQAVRTLSEDVPDEVRIRAGLRAFLEFVHDEPAFATVFYVELPSVGRRGADRLAAAHEQFAAMNAAWHARARSRHPEWPDVPAAVFRALTGATEELVREKVRGGRTDEVLGLEDVVVALHLRLLTGSRW